MEQEGDSVAIYAQQFISLSRFAPDLVATEARNVKKFIFGLRFGIQHFILGRRNMTLDEAIETTKLQEYMADDEAKNR